MTVEGEIIQAVAHVLCRFGHDAHTRFHVMCVLKSIGDTVTAEWALDELKEVANHGARKPWAGLE